MTVVYNFEESPIVNYSTPKDIRHLFCNKCLKMYQKNKYTQNINIVIYFDKDSKQDTIELAGKTFQAKNLMPLLKAWAAFVDYFTGGKTTFTIADSIEEHVFIYPKPNAVFKTGNMPKSILFMIIRNEPVKNFAGDIKSYAYMQASQYVTFKSGVLLSLPPAHALTYMVHEVTAHRFNADLRKPLIQDLPTHYFGEEPHIGHCATSPIGKSKCLNGRIDGSHFANFQNAIPFFEKWLDDHKDDPITMFNAKKKKKPDKLPPKDTTLPAAYAAASPEIPEPADIDPVVEV